MAKDFLKHTEEKFAGFNDTQGGVDPMGTEAAQKNGGNNAAAARQFSEKNLMKVDAMGTDYPKKEKGQSKMMGSCGPFKTDVMNEAIDPMGTEAGKKESGQSRH